MRCEVLVISGYDVVIESGLASLEERAAMNGARVPGERVTPQEGGWIVADLEGLSKARPGSEGW